MDCSPAREREDDTKNENLFWRGEDGEEKKKKKNGGRSGVDDVPAMTHEGRTFMLIFGASPRMNYGAFSFRGFLLLLLLLGASRTKKGCLALHRS